MQTFHFLHLVNTPILQQLQIEEALLRADERNWIILSEGSSPAIVMGIFRKTRSTHSRSQLESESITYYTKIQWGGGNRRRLIITPLLSLLV